MNMSVDEAFRRLMASDFSGNDAPVAAAPAPAAAGNVAAMHVAAPEATAPEPIRPAVEPLDFSQVRHARRFAYFPIDNRSQIAEEYRILRTRLASLELALPSILLTSCHHNEGKTNTALHLALAKARRRGSRILLVDFDLRRPRLHKMLGLPKAEYDIVSVLRQKCDPEAAIIYSEEDNLHVLSAKREYAGGTDFLEARFLQPLFDKLHASFDFIVVDSCPCLSTSDPAILGPYVGGVMMIVRSLQTQRESIEHAISNMQELDVPVIGVVLTFVRYFLPRYLYRYQYYHGYYNYYQGYSDATPPDPVEREYDHEHERDPPHSDYLSAEAAPKEGGEAADSVLLEASEVLPPADKSSEK